jgi:CheY-like chemotaxis protein
MVSAYAEMLKSSGDPLTGVDFILSKPFLLADLREAIARVLPGS